jgi:predicted enzyme related to lactoylglutathione lyase
MKLKKIKFVLYVKDFEKMKTFYQEVFGLNEVEGTKGWSELELGDFILALDSSSGVEIEETRLSFYVSDLQEACQRIIKYGGKITVEPEFTKGKAFRIGKAADPEGNHFYIAKEFDSESKAEGWSGI